MPVASSVRDISHLHDLGGEVRALTLDDLGGIVGEIGGIGSKWMKFGAGGCRAS